MLEEPADTRSGWKKSDLKIVLILTGIYILRQCGNINQMTEESDDP